MVGVPLMAPVVVFNDNPAGRVGETDQDVIAPPPAVGAIETMATSFVSVAEVGV